MYPVVATGCTAQVSLSISLHRIPSTVSDKLPHSHTYKQRSGLACLNCWNKGRQCHRWPYTSKPVNDVGVLYLDAD